MQASFRKYSFDKQFLTFSLDTYTADVTLSLLYLKTPQNFNSSFIPFQSEKGIFYQRLESISALGL